MIGPILDIQLQSLQWGRGQLTADDVGKEAMALRPLRGFNGAAVS